MRTLTRTRIEAFARRRNATTITSALMDEKYAEWGMGSVKQSMTLEWGEAARERMGRIPEFIRGMVILEVERCARAMGLKTVTEEVIDRVKTTWEVSGVFHSGGGADPYR